MPSEDPACSQRIRVALSGSESSTYGPTPTHRMSLDDGLERLERVRAVLDTIARESLPSLEAELSAAGAPWSPGRSGR